MSRLVPVAEFGTSQEAALAQGLLEDEGIVSHVSGQMGQAFGFGITGVEQTVRLAVPEEDAERAAVLLRRLEARIEGRARRDIDEEIVEAPPPEPPGDDTSEGPDAETETDGSGGWEEPDTPADRAARRLFLGAAIGIAAGIAMWATLIVWLVRPPPDAGLTDRGQRHLRIARVFLLLGALKSLALWFAVQRAWVLAT